MEPDKDHETVIKAFVNFVRRNPDGCIFMIGDGSKRQELMEIVRLYKLEKNVRFTGAMENPYGYLRGAVANILSSYCEGLPTVIVEAFSLGVLNIASDCPDGPRELLMDGGAGVLFPSGDAGVLAQILDDTWNNRINASEMIRSGSESLGRFSAAKIIAQIEPIFGVQNGHA